MVGEISSHKDRLKVGNIVTRFNFNFSHNEINLLPPEVEELNEFLKFFLISYNSLTSIPQQFSKLANLVKYYHTNKHSLKSFIELILVITN